MLLAKENNNKQINKKRHYSMVHASRKKHLALDFLGSKTNMINCVIIFGVSVLLTQVTVLAKKLCNHFWCFSAAYSGYCFGKTSCDN